MKKIEFTEDERKMINYILHRDTGSLYFVYLPWILIPSCLFFYGIYVNETPLMITGFLLIFFLCARSAYLQIKLAPTISSIIQKYEKNSNEE